MKYLKRFQKNILAILSIDDNLTKHLHLLLICQNCISVQRPNKLLSRNTSFKELVGHGNCMIMKILIYHTAFTCILHWTLYLDYFWTSFVSESLEWRESIWHLSG